MTALKALRKASQPTHDTNRRALALLAVVLVGAMVFLAVTHHYFGLLGHHPATTSPSVSTPAAHVVTPAPVRQSSPGPAPNFSRNPFQGP